MPSRSKEVGPKNGDISLHNINRHIFTFVIQDKIAKKPYNPIIGEMFQCSFRVPKAAANSPEDLLITYCAEQVSHHPPISAFRFYCPQRKMEMVAGIFTQSRWKGLSIYVNMVGKGRETNLT